ncbi:50S ribosomal protein L18Ae [Candidatus Methanoplasma termitum]|uniref:Large ribosomal subunit protein eL20 n=1 Tax=Candidatus Methanoplasma termitum TaxID=1577791 RepID=A0A0A7LE06_9ARCH|nr:50S ribosomal protein L18Ae [Candidatus Methanoplasma termitum]AIZ57309.1 50S ribosomal protein L18Ae [Candidatus Methanoplasma termitum]
MKAFRVTGTYADPRKRQSFSIEVSAENEDACREKTLSTLGSKHRLKRWEIDITEIVELSPDQVTNHVVKYDIEA